MRARLAAPDTPQVQVLDTLRARLSIRQTRAALHPNATQFTIHIDDTRVFALWRQSLDRQQSIFALHNVSAEEVHIPALRLNLIGDVDWADLLSREAITSETVTLAPYQCRWISNTA